MLSFKRSNLVYGLFNDKFQTLILAHTVQFDSTVARCSSVLSSIHLSMFIKLPLATARAA